MRDTDTARNGAPGARAQHRQHSRLVLQIRSTACASHSGGVVISNRARESGRVEPARERAGHYGNRHRRSEEARQAVLEAADGLLAEVGFARLTIEGIAARAGVGKQTIYRWWPSKTAILIDAFIEDEIEDLTALDTGDLGADLRAHLNRLAAFLTKSEAGTVFRALVGEAQHDSNVASRLRADFVGRQSDIYRLTLRRAQERGALGVDVDLNRAIDQLVGPIYFRVLVTDEPITCDFTDALVADFVDRNRRGSTRKPPRS